MSLKNKIAKNIRLIRIQREQENKCVLKIYVWAKHKSKVAITLSTRGEKKYSRVSPVAFK